MGKDQASGLLEERAADTGSDQTDPEIAAMAFRKRLGAKPALSGMPPEEPTSTANSMRMRCSNAGLLDDPLRTESPRLGIGLGCTGGSPP